jgi:cysteine desulfurase
MKRIYLDTAAGTTLDRKVARIYKRALTLGNPSSIHREGVVAKEALESARAGVAQIMLAHPDEIIFTSGGTESNNLAIKGLALGISQQLGKPGHIIVSAVEHSSVLEPARELEQWGWRVSYLPVNHAGLIDPQDLKAALQLDTRIVSIIYAQNEIGTIMPLVELRRVVDRFRKEQGTPYPYLHTDACQAGRFLPLNTRELGVDLLTANAAKIYGPRGTGILFKRRAVPMAPLLSGGGQEHNFRSGTESVAGAIAFKAALDQCEVMRFKEVVRLTELRDYFISRLLDLIPDTELNGDAASRLAGNINILVRGVNAEWMVLGLDARGIAASTGSACSFNTKDESYVIMALGRTRAEAESSIRFTLDRGTTKRQVDYVARELAAIVKQARDAQ